MNVSFSAQESRPPAIIMIVNRAPDSSGSGDMMGATSNFIQAVRNPAQSVIGNVSQSDARLNRLA